MGFTERMSETQNKMGREKCELVMGQRKMLKTGIQ